jgi:hypothetical protein
MNPKNHPRAYQFDSPGDAALQKTRPPEETLNAGTVAIERKTFDIRMKQNHQGRFLRITEKGGTGYGKHSIIIIPESGLKDFQKALADMIAAASSTPAGDNPHSA